MGLFDGNNVYGGGGTSTQIMRNDEFAELRTLPPGVRKDILPKTWIPEQNYGDQNILYILSHETFSGSLSLDFLPGYGHIDNEPGYIPHILEIERYQTNYPGLFYEREEQLNPRGYLHDFPVFVEYELQGASQYAYAMANQFDPKVINFSDSFEGKPLFSSVAAEGKNIIFLNDVPRSTIHVVDPSLEGMVVKSCESIYASGLLETEKGGQIMYDWLLRSQGQASDEGEQGHSLSKP